jgi:hypothetical protein
MREWLFGILEVLLVGVIAIGAGLASDELGVGLIVAGVGWLVLAVAAQVPSSTAVDEKRPRTHTVSD